MTDLPSSSVPPPIVSEETEECSPAIEPCIVQDATQGAAQDTTQEAVKEPVSEGESKSPSQSSSQLSAQSPPPNSDTLPTLPSQAHVSLKDMLVAVEEQHDAESKLTIAIAFMERAMSQKDSPDFRTFYALRKICQELFRGSIATGLRQKLWERYNELQEEKKTKVTNWNAWIAQGAPGSSAWVAYSIRLTDGGIIECYSYTKKGWCDIPPSENFLGTLLRLSLTPLDPAQRRRIGPMPREHERDERPFWNPPMIIDGKVISHIAFDAWRTRWPKDTSEMSNKLIDLYLPKKGSPGLAYFPYWLQIGGAVGKVQVRIIDSGTGLHSPKPTLPLRPLAFIHTGCWQEGRFRLWLQTRPYHGEIRLFAFDTTGNPLPRLIPFTRRPTQDPNIQILEITPADLQGRLESGHSYRWRATSTALPAMWSETDPIPFHFPSTP